MFPFEYTDYPQQAFLPNLHSSHERTNLFHHHNYLPHQMGIILPQTLNQDPSTINIINQNQDSSSFNYNPNAPYELFTSNNQASLGLSSSTKKDRHTKISTAHGVRDRRVRLSMAIAREFFDLQDLLGFDKASKTIGWLLAKSKVAIQELVLAKRGSGLPRSNSLYVSHEEDAFANFEMGIRARKGSRPSTFVTSSCNESALDRYPQEEIENQSNSIVAKKNRTKARARARERTKEKLSIVSNSNQFDELGFQTSGKTGCCSSSSHLLTNEFKDQDFSRSLIEKEACSADLQSLNGSNVVRNRHSSSSDYLQNLQSTNVPTSDQDGSIRVNNNLPNLLLGSEYNTEPSATSFSGWNIFTFPTEMNANGKQWGNQVQKQSGST